MHSNNDNSMAIDVTYYVFVSVYVDFLHTGDYYVFGVCLSYNRHTLRCITFAYIIPVLYSSLST